MIIVILFMALPLANILIVIVMAKKEKQIKFAKKISKYDKYIMKREVPNDKNTAVGVALLIYNLRSLTYLDPGNRIFRIIQATILELNIKGFIKIYEGSNKRIILKMIEKDKNELTSTQNVIYDFIRKISNKNKELEADEIGSKIRENKKLYRKTFGEYFVNLAIREQKNLENIEKDMKKYEALREIFVISLINIAIMVLTVFFCFMESVYATSNVEVLLITGTIMSIFLIYNVIILVKIIFKMLQRNKVWNYTQPLDYSSECITKSIVASMTDKGIVEAEEWKAFQRYLRNYTLIKEYKTQSLIVNQKFLIYATLFGIADKVQWDLGKFKPIIFWNY